MILGLSALLFVLDFALPSLLPLHLHFQDIFVHGNLFNIVITQLVLPNCSIN